MTMTTDNSRADALTDEQFEDRLLPLLIKHLDSKARHYLTREYVRDGIEVTRVTTYAMNLARAILAAFPVEQPEKSLAPEGGSEARGRWIQANCPTGDIIKSPSPSNNREFPTSMSESDCEHRIALAPSQPAAAPLDKPSVNDTITFSGDSLTLSGAQLLEALDFIAPDRDADQLESEVTIQYGEGHTGKGMYCWCTEYPEEGAIFIDGSTAVPAAPAPSPADERAAFEWPLLPLLPETVITTADGEAVFTAHQMQGYANAYGEMVRAHASAANETGAEGADALAHEVWSAAQRAPGEGIEDAVQRIAAILSRSPAMAAEVVGIVHRPALNGQDFSVEWLKSPPAGKLYAAPQTAQADALVGLTDEQILSIAEKRHASHPGVDEWWEFRDRADVIAFARALLATPQPEPRAEVTDTMRLDWLRDETCDLRCIDIPTGAGDSEVRWVVVQHHMSKPHEREIGRSHSEDPREAIDAARTGASS
ncbi:nuclear transport factor 2 family protein [Burkholderia vietnamiensis]|uniref:hypothetical protein n=1 Tax=Burkholderia vietnamiensis TaxID=60552 RepID=UPI001CF11925|nr:hypothetical protein [Burkholderia vietnamiensis]MCA8198315.1 hypothetical protein [Burkholderia vietnamiensis]